MWSTFAIVFIILGILVLSLRGFFGAFPDNWEWVGIVLAGVGLAIATPSIFQMIWGHPKLKWRFENGRFRVALPPTFSVAACIMVVLWDAKGNKAIVLPDRLREASELAAGSYQVQIILSIDGEPIIVSRQFIVGKKADDFSWINPK